MRRSTLPAAVFAMLLGPIAAAEQRQPRFTDDFPIEDCAFVPGGGNAFFQLVPGRQLYLSNQQCMATGECDELEEVWITVLPQKRTIVLKDDGRERRVTTARDWTGILLVGAGVLLLVVRR